jgi:hypothetical protein
MKPIGIGAAFVRFYTTFGPLLARAISKHEWARAMVRVTLQPLADVARATTGGAAIQRG